MAALYDPRYDYPNPRRQSFIGYQRDLDKRNEYLRKLYPNTVPPAQAAPALQTGAYAPEMPIDDFAEPPLTEAQKHARANIPAVATYYNENGDLVPANTDSINAYQGDIVSNNTDKTGGYLRPFITSREEAAAEAHRRKMLTPSAEMYGNAMQVGGNRALTPEDDLNAFQRNVLNISNALQKTALGQAMTDPDILTKLTITHNGVEIPNTRGAGLLDKIGAVYTYFTSNGMDESSASSATLKAVHEAANNSSTEQDPSQRDEIPLVPDHPPMGMSFNAGLAQPPALTTPNESGTVVTQAPQTDKGVLTNPAPSKPTQSTVRSTTGGYTGNARGSALPDMQIGLNERLMRMGAAGLAAGGQGSLAQMGAMFGASADVNQANRQAEMDTFKLEEERRQAHADRVNALAASKNKGAGGGDIGSVGDVRMGMAKLQTALDMFDADTDSSLSGYNWQAIYSRLYGRTLGNEDEAKRLFLNELRLDSIMQRVAETKGAISNAEMQLFASQAPTMDSNDIVWTSWLKRQLQMQKIILNRLQTGQRVDESAPITTTMPNLDRGGGGSTGSGADADTLNAARKIVGG